MQPSKFTPIIISSLIIIFISLTPVLNLINILCCGGIIIGVMAGTYYYNNQLIKTDNLIQYKDGVYIGVLSGIISALVVVIGITFISMIINQNPIPELYKMIDKQGIGIPPEAEKFLQGISDEYNKRGFSITLTLVTLAVDIITYPLFGALGGLLTVSILSRRNVRK